MTQAREQLAHLFRETGSAHHRAFAATNGEDPAWPRWYAEHLSAPLSESLGQALTVSALEADLGKADAQHRAEAPAADWSEYYAEWFLQRYGGQ